MPIVQFQPTTGAVNDWRGFCCIVIWHGYCWFWLVNARSVAGCTRRLRMAQNLGFLALLFSTGAAWGALIPAQHLPEGLYWTNLQVGVVGGIPNISGWTVYTNCTSSATAEQINAALASCPKYEIVKLGTGTYSFDEALTMTTVYGDTTGKGDNVVLEGSGWNTVLTWPNGYSAYGLINIDSTYEYSSPPQDSSRTRNWTSGYAQGSTNIQINTSATNSEFPPLSLEVGQLICLDQGNDVNLVNPYGVDGSPQLTQIRTNALGLYCNQQQYVMITAISKGTNLTIWPGVYMTNIQASLGPQIWWAGLPITNCGIENLCIDGGSANESVNDIVLGGDAYNCWVENVEVTNTGYAGVQTYESAHCSMNDNYFTMSVSGGASTSYGINFFLGSDSLAQDNMFYGVSTPCLTDGGCGCVFAYNYMTNMLFAASPGWEAACIETHGAHPYMNLWEGNIGNSICMDFIHGSSSHNTVFRNAFGGLEYAEGAIDNNNTFCCNVMGSNRWETVIGNIFGNGPTSAGYYNNYEVNALYYPSNYLNEKSIYVLGFWGNYVTNNDPLTCTSLERDGNWDVVHNSVVWDTNGVQTLPASLYLTGEPTWWADYGNASSWPPIGPDVTPMQGQIPAQTRFLQLAYLSTNVTVMPPTDLRAVGP